jgi:hypothetical protein
MAGRYRNILFLSLFVVATLSGCLKDNFKFKKLTGYWNPDVAIPMVDAELSLNDVLKYSDENGNFQVGSDNFITLVYRGNLFSIMAKDFIQIPEPAQALSNSYSLSASEVSAYNAVSSGSFGTNIPAVFFPIDFGDNTIDSLRLNQGIISVNFSHNFPDPIQLSVLFPTVFKNGLPFTQTVNLPASSGSAVVVPVAFNLSGTRIIVQQQGGVRGVSIQQSISITRSPTTSASSSTAISSLMTYSNFAFGALFGKFNIQQQELAPNQDTALITLFNNVLSTNGFLFANPTIGVNIENSFGFPVTATLSTFKGYNPNIGPPVNINFPYNPFQIPYPSINQIGTVNTASYTLTNQNEIDFVMNQSPRFIIYKIDNAAIVTPPGQQNFVLDTSRFKVDFDINLPLDGRINELIFQDTMKFVFRDIEELESLSMKIFTDNGFPLGAKLQIFFADSSGFVREKLFPEDADLFKPAPINSSGRATSSVKNFAEIVFPEEKIANLERVTQMFVRVTASSTDAADDRNVKIYSDYRFGVKVSARAKLKYNLSKS